MSDWRFWIDRGGTFTDVVARTPEGELKVHKLLSEDPSRYRDAAVHAIDILMAEAGAPGVVRDLKMGTTVATNALLERRGEPTLLLVNRGYADALLIGYQNRPDLFALEIRRPPALYADVLEAEGRVDAEGQELAPLDADALLDGLTAARRRGLKSVAVCFLPAWRNPAHERPAGRLAAADIAGTVWYFSAGIGFAIGAFEAWSLIIAHVGASIVSTLAVLVAQPWAPIPSWRLAGLRHYLRFGAQFQGARLALMAKDSLILLLSPRTVGVDGTGLLSWADKIASQPLTLTQLVSRVTLPTFARMQDDMARVRRGAELTLKWNGIVTLPAFAAVIAFAPEIAIYIYGEQWLPAIPALYALAASAILVPINGLLTPILAALGRTRVILVIAILWAAAAWGLALALGAAGLGVLAIPIALAATQFGAALVLLPLARDVFDFRLLRHLARPLAAAVLAGAFGRLVLLPLLTDWVLLIQGGIVVVLLYASLIYLMDRETIRREAGLLFRRREPDPGTGS